MSEEYDILVKNGTIVDGTGAPKYKGAVAVRSERIVAVGRVEGDLKEDAKTVIDAEGRLVSPGFIDVHNHGDLSIIYYPKGDCFVRQGVTSFVGGQCGNSPGPFGDWIGLPWVLGDLYTDVAPKMYERDWLLPRHLVNERHRELYGWEIDWSTLGEFFQRLEAKGISPNFVPLVGHGDVRSLVMGPDFKRHATEEEIGEMVKHVDVAMREGCRGLSVGRDYDPGIWANFDEILTCAKIAAKYGGVYASHSLRTGHRKARRPGEFPPVATEGVLEAIDIGRKTGISVQISHLGNLFNVRPGSSKSVTKAAIGATLKIVDDAREEGLDVNFDTIPHHLTGGIGTSPYLVGSLSPWLKVAGGYNQLAKALRMPDMRDEIKEVIMSGKHYRLNPNITPDWAKTRTIVECSEEKFLNKTVAQIAEELGVDDLDALMNIISVDPETKAIRKGDDDWVKLEYYKHPEIMIGVDTFAVDETNEGRHLPPSLPNENAFGGHVRYLRRVVRETNILTWEEAIRKLTSSPARKFKMTDRGVLNCGAYADIVILNPETVTDRGDQLEPRRYPEGVDHVIVNGELVVSGSGHTGALPGKILYRE